MAFLFLRHSLKHLATAGILIAPARILIEIKAPLLHVYRHLHRIPGENPFGIMFLCVSDGTVFPAVLANAIGLEPVMDGLEVISLNDLVLNSFQFGANKFDGSMAFRTYDVMVMGVVVTVFKSGQSVAKRNLSGNAACRQGFERAKDRYDSDFLILFLYQSIDILNAEMTLGIQKGFQDQVLLIRLLESVLA
jgi:hypothetical protein